MFSLRVCWTLSDTIGYTRHMLTKAHVKAHRHYLKTTEVINRTEACAGGEDVKPNPYLLLPSVSWFGSEAMDLTDIPPTLHIVGYLLQPGTFDPKGTLAWTFPLFTEQGIETALSVLTSLGWDGRVFPHDPGWPSAPEDEENLATMMAYQGMKKATLTFPPNFVGDFEAPTVVILKQAGTFFPLDPSHVINPKKAIDKAHREKFMGLMEEWRDIFLPVKHTSQPTVSTTPVRYVWHVDVVVHF